MVGNDPAQVPGNGKTFYEAYMAFKKDLEKGHLAEFSVLNFLRSKHPRSYRVAGNEPELDIIVAEEAVGVEVKYDPRSRETGNFVVEVYHNKPSGSSPLAVMCGYFMMASTNIGLAHRC